MSPTKRLDPHLAAPLSGLLEALGGGLNLRDIPATRKLVGGMVAAVKAQAPPIAGIETSDLEVPGLPGQPGVAVRLYRPTGAGAAPLPALVWLHAGGFVLGDIELDDLMCRQLAKDIRSAVVSVDYRLAPEHPFPAALDDAHAVLKWLAGQAARLGLAPGRLAIAGASAGAGLAAGVALKARDEGDVHLAFQLLIYPTLDDRNVAQADDETPDTLFWTRENNLLAWTAYLGERRGGADVSPYAAPLRAADLGGLPATYIAVGDIDLFLEENLEFARRLVESRVPTELHVYPGAFHGFDAFAPLAPVSQRFVAERNAALIGALGA